jgi:hypothetical protein
MVVVMLDAPGLERVDQRHEHKGPHNVLNQVVLVEGAVPSIMANNKELWKVEGQISSCLRNFRAEVEN